MVEPMSFSTRTLKTPKLMWQAINYTVLFFLKKIECKRVKSKEEYDNTRTLLFVLSSFLMCLKIFFKQWEFKEN